MTNYKHVSSSLVVFIIEEGANNKTNTTKYVNKLLFIRKHFIYNSWENWEKRNVRVTFEAGIRIDMI